MAEPAIQEWTQSTFKVVRGDGAIIQRDGWVHPQGLGLYLNGSHAQALWEIVHLRTGHAVAGMGTDEAKAKRVAATVGACAPWNDFGLDFSNIAPDLQERVNAIMRAEFPVEIETHRASKDYEAAAAIAAERGEG